MKKNLSTSKSAKTVEVRGFGKLKKIFNDRGWSFPIYFKLEEECSAIELAKQMDLPLEQIESVIINGQATSLRNGEVEFGDRIAFVPPGTPGPYRAILGMVEK